MIDETLYVWPSTWADVTNDAPVLGEPIARAAIVAAGGIEPPVNLEGGCYYMGYDPDSTFAWFSFPSPVTIEHLSQVD